jgi:hypothetical protein
MTNPNGRTSGDALQAMDANSIERSIIYLTGKVRYPESPSVALSTATHPDAAIVQTRSTQPAIDNDLYHGLA